MYPAGSPRSSRVPGKKLILSIKQRTLLRGLLHRDLRKCSASALACCQRVGWIGSAGGGYELTTEGRRVAEISELADADRELVLDLS